MPSYEGDRSGDNMKACHTSRTTMQSALACRAVEKEAFVGTTLRSFCPRPTENGVFIDNSLHWFFQMAQCCTLCSKDRSCRLVYCTAEKFEFTFVPSSFHL